MARRKTFLVMAVFFIVVTIASTWFFWVRTESAIGDDQTLPADGKLHVLLVGVDDGLYAPDKKGRGRSDTLMVASYDPKSGEISLLSIPRDTRVEIPGRKYKERINHAFAYGGIDLTMRTVRQFLHIPLRYYVQIDTAGFRRLVDAIGGVPIDVEKDMKYTDKAGGLYIDLKAGPQVLNGEQAEGYVRFRKTDSDLMRAQRQQKFIAAAIKEVVKPGNLLKINQLYKIATDAVQTNIPVGVALRYLPLVKSLQGDKITTHTIEGSDLWLRGVYYYEPDMDKLAELVETYFYSGLDKSINQQIKVRVAIGNGNQGSGKEVAHLLSKNGFDVRDVIMADRSDYQVSQVISTRKQSDGAVAVAEVLSIHEILRDIQAKETADVIVIVGKDMLP